MMVLSASAPKPFVFAQGSYRAVAPAADSIFPLPDQLKAPGLCPRSASAIFLSP